MSLSAGAPLPALMTSLARAGWGDLAGRELQGIRTTLNALVAQLPHRSGEGLTTAEQVAQSAGLSVRWVRRCLHYLEDLGLVIWRRGGVQSGLPAPSHFRIVKTMLVDLVRAARPIKEAADLARRAATTARLAALRRLYVGPQARKRRPGHAELGASPRPYGEGPRAVPARPSPPESTSSPCDHGEPRGAHYCALCRHGIAAA